jgi:hypothetical protein
MSWIDMYEQSLKTYKKMSESYLDYEQKMKMFYELFGEANSCRLNACHF